MLNNSFIFNLKVFLLYLIILNFLILSAELLLTKKLFEIQKFIFKLRFCKKAYLLV